MPTADRERRAERISKGLRRFYELRRQRLRVLPSDLTAIEHGLPVRAELRPLLAASADVAERLLEAIGGTEGATAQETLLVSDVARLDVLIAALFRRVLIAGDADTADLATKIGTLVGQRRASLLALGLSERREEKSLDEYVRARSAAQTPAGATIEAPPAREPTADAHDASSASEPLANPAHVEPDPANGSPGSIDAAQPAAEQEVEA